MIKHVVTAFLAAILLTPSMQPTRAAEWENAGEWVLMDGARYFPLGIWPTPAMTADEFRLVDMVYVHRTIDYRPDEMRGKVLMVGSNHFQWVFSEGYDGSFVGYGNNRDITIDYDEMQGLLRVGEAQFGEYLRRRVVQPWESAIDSLPNPHWCWYSVDEPDQYGHQRGTWCWNPELTRRMSRAVKTADNSNDLVIISFGPPKRGNYHFYDANIPALNPPPEPPILDDRYKRHYDNSSGAGLEPGRYFNDVRYTVTAYRGSGDVWMLNDYHTFFQAPEYAGITVDAIHAAIDSVGGSRAAWLWFDPGLIDYHPSYGVDKFECPIYTAIVHGCTGVFMFCTANTTYVDHLSAGDWDAAERVLTELRDHSGFLYGGTLQRGTGQDGRLHYSIRIPAHGSGMELLVTNTGDRPLTIPTDAFSPVVTLPDAIVLPPYGHRFVAVSP